MKRESIGCSYRTEIVIRSSSLTPTCRAALGFCQKLHEDERLDGAALSIRHTGLAGCPAQFAQNSRNTRSTRGSHVLYTKILCTNLHEEEYNQHENKRVEQQTNWTRTAV